MLKYIQLNYNNTKTQKPPTEKAVVASIIKFCNDNGIKWEKTSPSPYGKSGNPDFAFFVNGQIVYAEIKGFDYKCKPTLLQLYRLAQLHIQGFKVFLVNDLQSYHNLTNFLTQSNESTNKSH